MLVFFARSGSRHPILPVALGLLDRRQRLEPPRPRSGSGHVTDFIDLRYWPAFNLADSFIVLGVLVLARRAAAPATRAAAAAAGSRRSALRVPAGSGGRRGSTGFSPSCPRSARARRPERLVEGGNVRVDGACAAEELPARGRRGARGRAPAGAARRARARGRSISASRYEDEHLLVVDKPAGVVVHPGAGPRDGHARSTGSPAGSAGGAEDRPGIVHRLDSRHVRAARRRPLGRGARAAARSSFGARELERQLRRARPGAPALAGAGGSRRRSAATATIRRGSSLDTDSPREAVTHFEVGELLGRLRAPRRAGSRPAARTRSACTWPAIDLPVVGRPRLRRPATRRSSASSCTRTGSRSSTRSRASGSTSSRRCRTIWPRISAGCRAAG